MKFKFLLPISIFSVVAIGAVGVGSNYLSSYVTESSSSTVPGNSTSSGNTTNGDATNSDSNIGDDTTTEDNTSSDSSTNDNTSDDSSSGDNTDDNASDDSSSGDNTNDDTSDDTNTDTTVEAPTVTSNITTSYDAKTSSSVSSVTTFFSSLVTTYEASIGNINATSSISTSLGTSYANLTTDILQEYVNMFGYNTLKTLETVSDVADLKYNVAVDTTNTYVDSSSTDTISIGFTISVSYTTNSSNVYFAKTYSTNGTTTLSSSGVTLSETLDSYIVDSKELKDDTSSTTNLPLNDFATESSTTFALETVTSDYISNKDIEYTNVWQWSSGQASSYKTTQVIFGTIETTMNATDAVTSIVKDSSKKYTVTLQTSATGTKYWYGIDNTMFDKFTFDTTDVNEDGWGALINENIDFFYGQTLRTSYQDVANTSPATKARSWYLANTTHRTTYSYDTLKVYGTKDASTGIISFDITVTSSTNSNAATEHLYLDLAGFPVTTA